MELSMFEATVLRERGVWKIGRLVLMAAWVIWVTAWVGPVGKRRILRPLLAASVCLIMAIYFVVPGPWKILRSLGGPFWIGPEIESVVRDMPKPGSSMDLQNFTTRDIASLGPVGEIPGKGDLTLRIKRYAIHARPLLHALLLFVPTVMVACLVGCRPAAFLMVILALGTEAAQFSFGYGFDTVDVFDLFADGIGIVSGLMAHRWLLNLKFPPLAEWLADATRKTSPRTA
jgi:hypothetical protein